ncbi:hypothetical protein B1J93_10320 [Leptospira kirschneri serovar Pomona]|uniref:Transposase n=1 Tax=Leptospira kirschneri serovar Pomona TaxID=561005 RepID=A0A1T1DP12_9LEPT|nr:hypothetical protein B1J93_10320 [Leptospira kirschneri serovar Pomona]
MNTCVRSNFPCDPTSLVKWRKRIGSDGVEKFLEETIFSFELFFVIWEILSLHRFYFQFESCFFSFRQKSQFFRDD